MRTAEQVRERDKKMTYEEAKAFLADCNRYKGEISLEPLKKMLAILGNPQDQLKFVHVAGTNGKGSTLAYVSTVLKEAGYRVGRYISPTIFSYRERIQVNETYISREGLVRLTEQIQKAGEQMLAAGDGHPTMFEAETALAFLWFVEKKCDIVVLEVGMGGLTDATNVIKNTLVAALTPVSMDHIGVLGNTLGEIAAQKAGIIKKGCKVVSAAQKPESRIVIEQKAKECGCPMSFVDTTQIRDRNRGLMKQSFSYKERTQVEISLAGEYQFENAALALDVLDELNKMGYVISEEAIRKGMSHTIWQGRFSVVAKEPLFLMDGAHNRDAARVLRDSILQDLKGRRLIFIMGVLADKEYEVVAEQTAPLAEEILTIMTPDNPRALSAEALAETVRKYNPHVRAMGSIRDAVREARRLAGSEDVILAFGSLSYLGELYREANK